MWVKSLKNSEEGNHYEKVVGKEPETLVKYEFLFRYFSKILSQFPEDLFFRASLNGSEHL